MFPSLTEIEIRFPAMELPDPTEHLAGLLREKAPRPPKGARVGLAIGSRGIWGIRDLARTVVDWLGRCGARPVILPAMGSHGGATASGQAEVLASYGITEENLGAPIMADMATVELGATPQGWPVYFDRVAAGLDGLILMNRVKPHTDFHHTHESGLLKQAVIGLGNHRGAEYIHTHGLAGLREVMPASFEVIAAKAPLLFGVAILENALDTTAELHLVEPGAIKSKEPELLARAGEMMPYIPFENLDVLVLERMGKNISGVGLDSNITGRRFIRQDSEPDRDKAARVVCLDLSEESHGNALGVGLADLITKALYDKIDFDKTYANVVTSGFLERGFVPMVMPSEKEAIATALTTCGRRVEPGRARLVQLADTLHVSRMLASDDLLSEMPAGLDFVRVGRREMRFDQQGRLENRLAL